MFERFRNRQEQTEFKFPHLTTNEDFLLFLKKMVLKKAFPDYYAKQEQALFSPDKQKYVANEPNGHKIMVIQLAKMTHRNLTEFEQNCKKLNLPTLSNTELNNAAELYEHNIEIINYETENHIFDPHKPDELVMVDDITERQPDQAKITDTNGKLEIKVNSKVRLSEKGKNTIYNAEALKLTKDPDANLRSTVTMLTQDGKVIIKPDVALNILQDKLIVTPDMLIVEST